MHPSVSYYSSIFIPTFHSFDLELFGNIASTNFQTKYLSGHVQQCTLVTSPLAASSILKQNILHHLILRILTCFCAFFILELRKTKFIRDNLLDCSIFFTVFFAYYTSFESVSTPAPHISYLFIYKHTFFKNLFNCN
jgi:hypothetical protein